LVLWDLGWIYIYMGREEYALHFQGG
jgi:hypothetical protein